MHDFPGMIAAANGGTLFLDEISDMRQICRRAFCACSRTRVSAAWQHANNESRLPRDSVDQSARCPALSENRMRSDLYYRLNTFQIEVPPLRKRKEDIQPLIAQFVKQFSQQLGKPEPDISPDAFQKLLDYAWPGNVRELQNAIEYAVVLARQGMIGVKELPGEIQLPSALQQSEIAAMPRSGVQLSTTSSVLPSSRHWQSAAATRKKQPNFSASSAPLSTTR